MGQRNPPSMAALLQSDLRNDKPIAVVLAGHEIGDLVDRRQ